MADTKMPKPPQGVRIQGGSKTPPATPPVGHLVKLATGRASVDTKAIKTQTKMACC